MGKKRSELKFQAHIIDSYKTSGGYACKWNDEYGKGKPDLVAAHFFPGQHLVEVKHRPDFDLSRKSCPNQLDPRQKVELKKFMNAGGKAYACLVINSENAIGSMLAFFDPLDDTWDLEDAVWAQYNPGTKYNLAQMFVDMGL